MNQTARAPKKRRGGGGHRFDLRGSAGYNRRAFPWYSGESFNEKGEIDIREIQAPEVRLGVSLLPFSVGDDAARSFFAPFFGAAYKQPYEETILIFVSPTTNPEPRQNRTNLPPQKTTQ